LLHIWSNGAGRTVGKIIRSSPLRTLTFGLLTPFYFIRAGSLVSCPLCGGTLDSWPLLGKMVSKCVGVYPATRSFGRDPGGRLYDMLMSTG